VSCQQVFTVMKCNNTKLINSVSDIIPPMSHNNINVLSSVGNICLSDVVLVLGLGGAVAYIWKYSLGSDQNKRYSSNSFLDWLFAEDRLSGDVLRNSVRNNSKHRRNNANIITEHSDNSDEGLNILKGNTRRPEKFLKQRLFDLRQLRDTSRFRDSCHRSGECYSDESGDAEEECGYVRGTPDGEERLVNSEKETDEAINSAYPRSASKPEYQSPGLSPSMKNVMRDARDLRRLIRETSFDSLASDFSLDLEFNEINFDVKSDISDNNNVEEEEDDNDVTIVEDKEEYVLDKSLLNRFENAQMWRLTNSTRESSLVSDYSYDFKSDRQLRLVGAGGGYASDDMASLIGSTADALEWDEDLYMDGELLDSTVSETCHSAWLPDYDQELDLESELLERRMFSPSPVVKEHLLGVKDHPKIQSMTRLPPSGSSSVESLTNLKSPTKT